MTRRSDDMPQNGIGQSPLSATFGLKGRIVACILLFLNAGISWAQGIEWPEGKKAAVVLTYDDALESQLVHAAPALEKHGFRGTFFLDEHRVEPANFHRWADVAKKGHELGNHSLFHPGHSSYAFIKDSGYAIDEYTPKRMMDELRIMNKILFGIDGKDVKRSYAYPCYNRALIDGNFGMTPLADGSSTLDAVRNSGAIAFARGGDARPVVADFAKLDPMYVPSVMFPGGAVDEILKHIDETLQKGGLLVVSLHGVGGETLAVPLDQHERLLKYLAERKEIWVAPFGEVMRHIESKRKPK